MKKRICFLMIVLVSLFFCSCEFMCVKEVRDSYLLIDDDDEYKFFYIPTGYTIDDHTNVNIFFQIDIEGDSYTGEIFIDTLNTKKEDEIDKVFF